MVIFKGTFEKVIENSLVVQLLKKLFQKVKPSELEIDLEINILILKVSIKWKKG